MHPSLRFLPRPCNDMPKYTWKCLACGDRSLSEIKHCAECGGAEIVKIDDASGKVGDAKTNDKG